MGAVLKGCLLASPPVGSSTLRPQVCICALFLSVSEARWSICSGLGPTELCRIMDLIYQVSCMAPRLFFSLFFSHPTIYYLRPSCSLCLLVIAQIRGHIAGSSPASPHYGSCLAFLSLEDEDFLHDDINSALPSSIRGLHAYTPATRRYQQLLILCFSCK